MSDPQLRYAVERALQRVEFQRADAEKMADKIGCTSLQLEGWASEAELLEAVIDMLKAQEADAGKERGYCVAYNQYGDWTMTKPFKTRQLAQAHIDRYLVSGVHNGDKSHYKHKQIIPVWLDKTVDTNPSAT